ncbi:Hypothetical protein NTJ_01806 [Nesidiocoris tenuis]|uniref:Uncharacterized protein n=1 Tax=Nesidiocoris tenuis TaxID=355587 RepID=A0ABN7ACD8_9HEMI|nr:Hypothetical protein NTJ_01806 [Nesidiocoris tenuis]
MPVLPFHHYIGPGNPIDSGPCVDADDCIAREHDIKYENARSPTDVRLADLEAIAAFRDSWMNGNWHSLIGDIGLSVKYCVESYTGVIYPKIADMQPCEMISLFNDLLKLHCVYKTRPFQKFNNLRNPLKISFEKDYATNKNEDNFFYVLVAWYQLWYKYHKNSNVSSNNVAHFEHQCSMMPPHQNATEKRQVINNRHLLQTCDLFHLNTWMKFFSLFQIRISDKTTPQENAYVDDDFGDLFMNYD